VRPDDGTIQPTSEGCVLRFVRDLGHPAEDVWAALTDPDARAAWFFAGRLEPTPGGVVDLRDSGSGILGRVLAAEPPWLLEFTWASDDAPGETVVRFELAQAPGGCTLTFTHTVGADAHPDRLAAGWHTLLDALPGHLAGEASGDGSAWAAHYARYRARVG
jgi:uncharacterized protein YndB with AHSA1/START domain